MNIEVEVKAKIADIEAIKEKLLSLDAISKGNKYQCDILLDPPQADFSKTDQVLRIRNTNGMWQLDYKSPRLDDETKSRKEFSLKIDDGKQLKDIFMAMNFKIIGEIEKHREHFELDNMIINLDTVANLGSFIEVETKGNEDNFEEQKKKIFAFLQKLGITETIKKDYLELLWDAGFFKQDTSSHVH